MEVDMTIVSLIFFLLFLLFLTLVAFLWYCGLFTDVDIKTCAPSFSELEVAYKFARGSFKDCGYLFTEAHSIAPNLRCIGIYYDDPDETEDYSMRYMIGVILNDKELPADDETKKNIQQKGYKLATFPKVEHVVSATFPHRTMFSVVIAVNFVIPSFRDYVKKRKLQAYPLIEICDGKEIIYAAPLSKQEDFFVPEALAESEEEANSDEKNEVEDSLKELEEIPDTVSSVDSLVDIGSKVEELPTCEQVIDSLEEKHKGLNNGSEASTESFEELQLDS